MAMILIKFSGVALAQFPQTFASLLGVVMCIRGVFYQLRQIAKMLALADVFFGERERTLGLKVRDSGHRLDVRIAVVRAGSELAPNAIQKPAIGWSPVGEAPVELSKLQ